MSWSLFTIVLGGVATLAIFSFLIRENPFFRFFEHLYIGIAAGFGIVLTLKEFFWPKIIIPMFGLDIVQYPDGTFSGERNLWYLLYGIPMAFGMLYYFIYSTKNGWLAKLVIGFSLGVSGGLAFKGFFNEYMPQIFSSAKPLIVFTGGELDWSKSLSNMVFVFTIVSVMTYFFFSFKRGGQVATKLSLSGRWLMMVCFGAFFGSTVMARMALLVERLQFLLVEWRGAVLTLLFSQN